VIGQLGDALRRAHDGNAWHGPALGQLVRDIAVSDASAHPVPGAHSIWELVLHLTSWNRESARRLIERNAPREPEDGDWPAVGITNDDAWNLARVELAVSQVELARALAAFPVSRLVESVDTTGSPGAWTPVTYHGLILGVIQHAAYHGGQIALLKKAIATATNG
jgi:uncharacterized damage-inducible protein DinB